MAPGRTSNKISCDACHARKIHCDARERGEPEWPCDWCLHHATPCTFNRKRGRRKPAKKASVNDRLASRLSRIEAALASSTFATRIPASFWNTPGTHHPALSSHPLASLQRRAPSQAPPRQEISSNTPQNLSVYNSSPQSLHDSTTRSSNHLRTDQGTIQDSGTLAPSCFAPAPNAHQSHAQIHFAGAHLGHLSSQDGIPLFSAQGQRWIERRTGEMPFFLTIKNSMSRSRLETASYSSLSTHFKEPLELPEQSFVERCLAQFSCSLFALAYPMIDPVLFQDTIRKAYGLLEDVPVLETIVCQACIFAFLGIFALVCQTEAESTFDGFRYVAKAHRMLPDMLQFTNLTTLQTVFMMVVHQLMCGHYEPGTMLLAIATRMMFTLGGQHSIAKSYSHASGNSQHSAALLRNLFWLCYIFDKNIALRTGHPIMIADEDCDLTIPEDCVELQYRLEGLPVVTVPSRNTSFDSVQPHMASKMRLSLLKAKTCRLLYSTGSNSKTDAEVICDIRTLDAELENWRQSMPAPFRPHLINPADVERVTVTPVIVGIHRAVLHLEYYHLLASIHRASGRCQGSPTGEFRKGDGDLKVYGLTSSMQIGAAASRSAILFMQAVAHDLAQEAFWLIVFYPMSAIITLFCGILVEPLGPMAEVDLYLLRTAASLIKGMPHPNTRAGGDQWLHLQYFEQFLDEIVNLGSLAVSKAEAERDQSIQRDDLEVMG